ncbi:MAG: dihydrodipicolinate synthase family protein [Verrucomicrobia bacterium]|nr:dihydrodipicolinate synthase family protein [Verrucomicrobiota bacterium]
MPIKWAGIFCALWTPTDRNGRLLSTELKTHFEFLRRHGVHGLLALGSTGEFLHLDLPLRKEVLGQAVTSGLPVLVNISDIRPKVVAELGQSAKWAGAAAVSILPPYFFPMAQEDMVEFFVRAGEAAQLPVFLYNFPERTGNRISLETIASVADRIDLVGVKQSGEFDYHKDLVRLGQEKNFVVLTGTDTRIPELMQLGVAGCVSGLANAVPDLAVSIYNAVKAGTPDRAETAIERMRRIGTLIEQLEFPLNVAAVMQARGLTPGHPKTVVSVASQRRYQKLVDELKRLFQEWKLA